MSKKKKNTKQADTSNLLLYAIGTIVLIVLLVLSVGRMGIVGASSDGFLSFLFGDFYLPIMLTLIFLCVYKLLFERKHPIRVNFFIGLWLVNIAIFLFLGVLKKDISTLSAMGGWMKEGIWHMADKTKYTYGAGMIGYFLYSALCQLFDRVGAILFLVLIFVIGVLLMIPFSFYRSSMDKVKESGEKYAEERRQYREEREREKEAERQRLQAEKEQRLAIERAKQAEIDRKKQEARDAYLHNPDLPVFIDKRLIFGDEEDQPAENLTQVKSKYFIDVSKKETARPAVEDPVVDIPVTEPAPVTEKAEEKETPEEVPAKTTRVVKPAKTYRLPPISLLDKADTRRGGANTVSAKEKGQKVLEILNNFGIPAELVNTHIGPSVTKFEIKPDSSVKVNRIQNVSDNIKMELAAKDIRIEAPIPGRNAVGIEIPNVEPVPVYMSELMQKIPDKLKDSPLLFVLGKDLLGKGVYCELDRMPHLLIAGATGSGKSVCINTIIMSLIMRNHPDDVKLVLVDPKKVEFTPYHDVPHLFWPVVTDNAIASSLLQRIVAIMEERYDVFAAAGVRKIGDYNELVERNNENLEEGQTPMNKMPYIVVIIEELADMMAIAGKEVELSIQRITQLARACGIHLIVATQRPSTDVITGLIKANIPSRISFAVSSSIDSRTILDQTGAERLLGYGDMLYYPQGESAPIRLQGVFVRDDEIKRVTDFLKKEATPDYDDTYFALVNNQKVNGEGSKGRQDEDPMMPEVVEYIREAQKASTSLLQRRFGIGYNRAARLIDALEEAGYIGPVNGSKPREVYLKKEGDAEEE